MLASASFDKIEEYSSKLGVSQEQLFTVFAQESAENLRLQQTYAEKLKVSVDELRDAVSKAQALIEVDESVQGQAISNVGGVVGKKNKPKIGIFSNIATKIRNAMSGKSDELSENPELAASGIITRALFESLEQDAISSKKVEQRILKKAGKEDSSIEEQ
jgi:hypothetical protein